MSVRLIRPAVSLLVLMTVLLGLVYPLVITGVAKAAFPHQAGGSLLYQDGKLIGSTLIGQSFSDPRVLLGTAIRNHPAALQRLGFNPLEPRTAQSRAHGRGKGECQSIARRRPG